MIVKPIPDAVIDGSEVEVEGWAWSHDSVVRVEVSLDGGATLDFYGVRGLVTCMH
jgi:hypothetical protein